MPDLRYGTELNCHVNLSAVCSSVTLAQSGSITSCGGEKHQRHSAVTYFHSKRGKFDERKRSSGKFIELSVCHDSESELMVASNKWKATYCRDNYQPAMNRQF